MLLMRLANRFCLALQNGVRRQVAAGLTALALALSLAGCSDGIKQLTDSVAALTDKHESLYSQMLDCEQRYADMLAAVTDLESVKQARPKMIIEAKKYANLGEQFLTTQGLTPEKYLGILERSVKRQQAIAAQIQEHMQRLTNNGADNQMRMAIPSLDWSAVQLDFSFDADAVAHGKKRHKEQMADQMEEAKARMQESRDKMKARMEESRARMEDMRAKMRRPPPGSPIQPAP
jgi:hypothetical protein